MIFYKPGLLCADWDEFLDVARTWNANLAEHGYDTLEEMISDPPRPRRVATAGTLRSDDRNERLRENDGRRNGPAT